MDPILYYFVGIICIVGCYAAFADMSTAEILRIITGILIAQWITSLLKAN